jgi:hypothetical protein
MACSEERVSVKCLICTHTEDRHRPYLMKKDRSGSYCTKCLGPHQPYSVPDTHQTFHRFTQDNLDYIEYEAKRRKLV